MTVSTMVKPTRAEGDNAEVNFTFPYMFQQDADLNVYLFNETTGAFTKQTLTTHYTVAGAGTGTGTVTFVTPPTTNDLVWIFRNTENSQELDLTTSSNLPSASLEEGLDKAIMLVQDSLGRLQENTLYLETTAAQSISPGGSDTNITALSGGPLPSVSGDARDNVFEVSAAVQLDGLGALEAQLVVWNGANGNSADGGSKVYHRYYAGGDASADARTIAIPPFILRPKAAADVKIGLGIQTASGTFDVHGVAPRVSWIYVKKLW